LELDLRSSTLISDGHARGRRHTEHATDTREEEEGREKGRRKRGRDDRTEQKLTHAELLQALLLARNS
jgi:hypothetical protein